MSVAMRYLSVSLGLALGLVSPVQSQTRPEQCKDIRIAKDRLACFDRMFTSTPTVIAAPKQDLAVARVSTDKLCQPRKLSEAIASILPAKSEFETSSAYQERAARAVKNVSTSTPTNDIVCEISRAHLIKYDADKQAFLVATIGTFEYDEKTIGSYSAKNAYGAAVTVEKKVERRWEVDDTYFGTVSVPTKTDVAQRISKQFAFGVVGDIRAPYLIENRYTSTPTFSNPSETERTTFKIPFRPKRAIAYDKENGEIFWSSPIVECKRYSFGDEKDLTIGNCPSR